MLCSQRNGGASGGSMSAPEPSPLLSVRPKRKTRFFLENAITKARAVRFPPPSDGPNPCVSLVR